MTDESAVFSRAGYNFPRSKQTRQKERQNMEQKTKFMEPVDYEFALERLIHANEVWKEVGLKDLDILIMTDLIRDQRKESSQGGKVQLGTLAPVNPKLLADKFNVQLADVMISLGKLFSEGLLEAENVECGSAGNIVMYHYSEVVSHYLYGLMGVGVFKDFLAKIRNLRAMNLDSHGRIEIENP